MKTKYFSKVDFWARELRLPLFWLTDPKHDMFKEGVLVFYKNNVVHVYHLDDKEIKVSEKGYKFFSNKFNVIKYKRQVQKIRNLIKRAIDGYIKLKISGLTVDELKKRIVELIGFLDSYSNIYTKTEPIVLSKIEADEKKYKKLIKELGGMRFILRKEGEPLFYNLFGVFLKEIAKRFNLRVADLFFYKFDELFRLFSGQKVKGNIVEERKRGYALICLKDKKILLTNKKFKVLYKDIVLKKSEAGCLEGRVAMMGKVKGRVRVILHNKRNIIKEVMNFRRGEILVTEMTRPDTVLACKKSAAIVTDEGGITSHAAIIAREMKKPCVVGTKIATQLLKTGDLVEVDADNGVVKILELNKKETQIYKKVMTRPMNLIDCEGWDVGERLMMPKKFKDLLFFDPLFIYTPNKAVATYYNFTDPKQNFQSLINFLEANISWFLGQKKQFDKDCAVARVAMKNDSQNYNEIVRLSNETWPMIAVANALGSTEKFKVSDELKKICIKVREESDDILHPLSTHLNKIISKKLKNIDLQNITLSEFLENKLPSKAEMIKRSKGWLYHKGKIYFDVEKYAHENNFEIINPTKDASDSLKGSVACKGRATGKAKIIFKLSELSKVKFGDILVTPMTTPEMIPVLKKAAAIITDEGGITCHASIVSRELKIPCVIGTVMATQVLHDGDLVEVDANNGVVKILK